MEFEGSVIISVEDFGELLGFRLKGKHHMQTEVSIEGAPEMDVDPRQWTFWHVAEEVATIFRVKNLLSQNGAIHVIRYSSTNVLGFLGLQ